MRYFDHDTTAGSDDKIMALRLAHGGAAVDAYWVLLEMMYQSETELVIFGNQLKTKSVCYRLCTDENTLKSWIETMIEVGLFEVAEEETGAIVSRRAMSNIEAYSKKRETARQNGKSGGRKPTAKPKKNQVGSDQETDSVAYKRKEKKEKENKIKERESPLPPLSQEDEEAAKFNADALSIFNEETGQDVHDVSPEAWQGLHRIRDSGRTLDDVRAVVRFKAEEWDSDRMRGNIRPSVLFGTRFEEYLGTARAKGVNVDEGEWEYDGRI